MKLLFVLERLSDLCGANVNIALNLIKQFTQNGYEVSAIALTTQDKPISPVYSGLLKKCIGVYDEELEFIDRYNARGGSKLRKYCSLFHPKQGYYYLDAYFNEYGRVCNQLKKAIEKACGEDKYDAVIGVSIPYYVANAVAKARISTRKCHLQLDPYTYNVNLSSLLRKKRWKIERAVCKRMDVIWAGSYCYRELLEQVIGQDTKLRGKVVEVELPGLVYTEQEEEQQRFADDGKIHFVFLGQFYREIRTPSFLLQTFRQLPENYVLHIVGGGCQDILDAYQEKMGGRLVLHGWVSKQEATQLMQKADFLVNVNNTIHNQLSSKLFEYIGTGKPIVNVCTASDCLSLKYMVNYPYAINVIEAEARPECLQEIEAFVSETYGKRVLPACIAQRFYKNTDEYFYQTIADTLPR